MAKVFVSHAKEDSAVAQRIAAYLEEQGIACWIAPRDVPPGAEYGAAILDGIAECDVLLLVLSERSNESRFVHREVERAVSKAKPVIPVRIREVAPSGALEFFISSAQWVDAWQPPMERHLAQLAAAVRALTAPGEGMAVPLTAPAAPAVAVAPSRRLRWLAAGLFVLLAALAGLLAWSPWEERTAPAERRDAAAFLAGTWCQPMSGEALAYWRFTALAPAADGRARVAGALSYSHSTQVQRFEAAAVWQAETSLTLTWLAPAELVEGEPLTLATDGPDRLTVLVAAEEVADPPPEPMTRCQP